MGRAHVAGVWRFSGVLFHKDVDSKHTVVNEGNFDGLFFLEVGGGPKLELQDAIFPYANGPSELKAMILVFYPDF